MICMLHLFKQMCCMNLNVLSGVEISMEMLIVGVFRENIKF